MDHSCRGRFEGVPGIQEWYDDRVFVLGTSQESFYPHDTPVGLLDRFLDPETRKKKLKGQKNTCVHWMYWIRKYTDDNNTVPDWQRPSFSAECPLILDTT